MAAKRKPTIYQVAEAAGVSIATVSRVFNDSDAVLPEVQRKVKAAAAKMHYVPSASARNLSTQRTESIGLILPVLYGEFFSEILYGIDVGLRSSKYTLMLSSTHDHHEEFTASFRSMQGRVDALIVMVLNETLLTSIAGMNVRVPVVLIGTERTDITKSSVAVDNRAGAASVAEHLASQGFKRLAVVTGSPDNIESAERLEGFFHGCEVNGIARTSVTVLSGTFSQQSGYDAAVRFLGLKRRPAAVFCSNDAMAMGMIRCFREQGIRIPHDVAVAGFDDIPSAELTNPSLTSVRSNIAELGTTAVQRVMEMIAHPRQRTTEFRRIIVPKLIVRESTGPQRP